MKIIKDKIAKWSFVILLMTLATAMFYTPTAKAETPVQYDEEGYPIMDSSANDEYLDVDPNYKPSPWVPGKEYVPADGPTNQAWELEKIRQNNTYDFTHNHKRKRWGRR